MGRTGVRRSLATDAPAPEQSMAPALTKEASTRYDRARAGDDEQRCPADPSGTVDPATSAGTDPAPGRSCRAAGGVDPATGEWVDPTTGTEDDPVPVAPAPVDAVPLAPEPAAPAPLETVTSQGTEPWGSRSPPPTSPALGVMAHPASPPPTGERSR